MFGRVLLHPHQQFDLLLHRGHVGDAGDVFIALFQGSMEDCHLLASPVRRSAFSPVAPLLITPGTGHLLDLGDDLRCLFRRAEDHPEQSVEGIALLEEGLAETYVIPQGGLDDRAVLLGQVACVDPGAHRFHGLGA